MLSLWQSPKRSGLGSHEALRAWLFDAETRVLWAVASGDRSAAPRYIRRIADREGVDLAASCLAAVIETARVRASEATARLDYAEAREHFEFVLAHRPEDHTTLMHLADVECRVGNYVRASALGQRAWELLGTVSGSDFGPIGNAMLLARAHIGRGMMGDARRWMDIALRRAPVGIVESIFQAQAIELLGCDHRGYFRGLMARLEHPSWASLHPHINPAAERWWKGERLDGTLLVHLEEGLGDQIQMARFVPLVRERCKRVVVEAAPALVPILTAAKLADEVVPFGTPCKHDAAVMMLSVPHFLDIGTRELAAMPPILSALASRPRGAKRVAIVWAGRAAHKTDGLRSLPYEALRTLAERASGVTWVSVQVGPRHAELSELASNVEDHSFLEPSSTDFLATAHVLSDVDLVLTVDSSPAHLAASMGLPTWVVLPTVPDARWGLGESTAWYPSARLIRRAHDESWAALAERIAGDLQEWARH